MKTKNGVTETIGVVGVMLLLLFPLSSFSSDTTYTSTELQNGVFIDGVGYEQQYYITVPNGQSLLEITEITSCSWDIKVRFGQPPTIDEFDYSDLYILLENPQPGNWYIGLFNGTCHSFRDKISTDKARLLATYTDAQTVPTVTTLSITDNGQYNLATGHGIITSLGRPNPFQHGLCWNTSGSPTTSDHCTTKNEFVYSTGTITYSIKGLLPNTQYYVRAYATNAAGTVYGGEILYTTPTNELQNGVSVTDLYLIDLFRYYKEDLFYFITVPNGRSSLEIKTREDNCRDRFGFSVYIRFGEPPTVDDYDYRYDSKNDYTFTLRNPQPGNWYIRLSGEIGYWVGKCEGISLQATDYGGPLLVADFSATPASGTVPLTVFFTDKSIGSITSWRWDFGDNSTSAMKNPSHTYNTPGKYTVSLTVRGPDGLDAKHANEFISIYSIINPGVLLMLQDE